MWQDLYVSHNGILLSKYIDTSIECRVLPGTSAEAAADKRPHWYLLARIGRDAMLLVQEFMPRFEDAHREWVEDFSLSHGRLSFLETTAFDICRNYGLKEWVRQSSLILDIAEEGWRAIRWGYDDSREHLIESCNGMPEETSVRFVQMILTGIIKSLVLPENTADGIGTMAVLFRNKWIIALSERWNPKPPPSQSLLFWDMIGI